MAPPTPTLSDMADRICPDCTRPVLFNWDEGCYVCSYCRLVADRRIQELYSDGHVNTGLSAVDRFNLGEQVSEILRSKAIRARLIP